MARQMGFSCLLIGVLVQALGAAQPPSPPGKITVSEKPIAKLPASGSANEHRCYISPDWSKVAFAASGAEGDQRLIVNGVPESAFGRVVEARVVWSPDGKRLAYVATDGADEILVLDGKEVARHKVVGDLTFSPDGKRFAYAARRSRTEHLAVVDGITTVHSKGVGGFVFSADSKRVGYVLTELNDMISYEAVVDGVHAPVATSIPNIIFSADGRRAASVAQYRGASGSLMRITLIEDGKVSTFDGDKPVFSPDGRRFAYVAATSKDSRRMTWECSAVVDGVAGKVYGSLVRLQFSPDSRHVVYETRASAGASGAVVVDGVEGPGDLASIGQFAFSPDGGTLAYIASRAPGKEIVVVNTRAVAEGNLRPVAPVFSNDGKWLRYLTAEAVPMPVLYVGVDGAPWPAEKPLRDTFPKHLWALLMQQPDSKDQLMVQGHTTDSYDRIIMEDARCVPPKQARFFIADTSTLRFFAVRNGQLLAVEVKYEWPEPK